MPEQNAKKKVESLLAGFIGSRDFSDAFEQWMADNGHATLDREEFDIYCKKSLELAGFILHGRLPDGAAGRVAGTMEMKESEVFEKESLLDRTLREQDRKKGLAGVMGKWPGDESDEEVEKSLEEMS